MSESSLRPVWRRAVGESALIIASVFVAIALEGMWSDRELHRAAVSGVGQVLVDMERDSADLDVIIAEQERLDGDYGLLAEWLSRPAPPGDSVTALLKHIAYSNRTLFPSRGAWTALQSEGLLRAVGDPDLVKLLSDFYGTLSTRIDYNNELYDAVHQDITFYDASAAWDFERERWLTSDPAARAAFANSARLTRGVWTRWYLDLMEDYVAAQGGAMAAVREYLRLNGG